MKFVSLESVIDIVSQIQEPQKVAIPNYVAEWIKPYRHSHTLLRVLNAVENKQVTPSAVNDWILDNKYDFIKAWLDGYTVEKEPLYTVEIPNPNSGCTYVFLTKRVTGVSIDMTDNDCWKTDKRNQLTEAEIRKDFEWAWQFAKEVGND